MKTTHLILLAPLAAACSVGGAAHRDDVAAHVQVRAPLLLTDMEGRTHDVDALLRRDRPVALVFWQTWCESCIREAPGLAAAAREQDGRVEFFGVVPGTDEYVDDEEVRRTAAEMGLPYPQVRDRDLALTDRYGVQGTPTIVVLGAGGRILFQGHRPPGDWSAFAGGGAR